MNPRTIMAVMAAFPLMAAAPAPLTDLTAAALAAMQTCTANHFTVSVAIVGEQGDLRVMLRADDAAPHTPEAAQRKAYTAMTFQRSTESMGALMIQAPDAQGLANLDGTLMVGGGLPIIRAGKLVGGIGVSGATGPGEDEKCAQAALDLLNKGGMK